MESSSGSSNDFVLSEGQKTIVKKCLDEWIQNCGSSRDEGDKEFINKLTDWAQAV